MAEALAALSLLCNVLQVAEFSFKILQKGYEIHKSATGVESDHEALQKCCEDLVAKNVALQQSLQENAALPLNKRDDDDDDDVALERLAVECNKEADELINHIRRVAALGSKSRVKSVYSALRGVWAEDKINATTLRMKGYQDQMNNRLIWSLNVKQKLLIARQSEGFDHLLASNSELSTILLNVQEGQQQMTDRQASHNQALVNIMTTQHDEVMRTLEAQRTMTPSQQDQPPMYEAHIEPSSSTAEHSKDDLLDFIENQKTDQVRDLLFEKPALAIKALDYSGRTALHQAATTGNLEVIRTLIKRGANINAQDEDNATPLHLAVKAGHCACVRYLLLRGANKDVKDEYNKLPSHYAARDSELEWILKYGNDINATDQDGITSLMHFVHRRNPNVVDSLLRQGATHSYRDRTRDATTPLIIASQEGYADIVSILISAGADVNMANKRRDTPLSKAAWQGHYDIVKLLLSRKAKLDSQNELNYTPLAEACNHAHDAIGQLLVEAGANVELLNKDGYVAIHQAAKNGLLGTIKAILARNPLYIELMSTWSWTPLAQACYNGHVAVVELLLQRGANHNWRPKKGLEPITALAAKAGHPKVIQRLVEIRQIDLELYDAEGRTALIHAITNRQTYTVHKLLQLGAKADACELSRDRCSPLSFAVFSNSRDILKSLLTEGRANPNLRNGGIGRTPLAEAVRRNQLDMVKDLLDFGADPNIVDLASDLDEGRHYPPVCIAAMNARDEGIEIMRVLIEKGKADLSLSNARHHWTALHEVACRGPVSAVLYLLEKGADPHAIGIDDSTGEPATSLDLALRRNFHGASHGLIIAALRDHQKKRTEEVECELSNEEAYRAAG